MDTLLRVWALGAVLTFLCGVYLHILVSRREDDEDEEEEEESMLLTVFLLALLTILSVAWPLLAILLFLGLIKRARRVT